jgi:hypothetical protein
LLELEWCELFLIEGIFQGDFTILIE